MRRHGVGVSRFSFLIFALPQRCEMAFMVRKELILHSMYSVAWFTDYGGEIWMYMLCRMM
jgi:hypothetical protein